MRRLHRKAQRPRSALAPCHATVTLSLPPTHTLSSLPPPLTLFCSQLDASHFSAVEWPRIREGIAIQTYEVLLER